MLTIISLVLSVLVFIFAIKMGSVFSKGFFMTISMFMIYIFSTEVLADFSYGEKSSYTKKFTVSEKHLSTSGMLTNYVVVCTDDNGNIATFTGYDVFHSILKGERYLRKWDEYRILGRISSDKNVKWIRVK